MKISAEFNHPNRKVFLPAMVLLIIFAARSSLAPLAKPSEVKLQSHTSRECPVYLP